MAKETSLLNLSCHQSFSLDPPDTSAPPPRRCPPRRWPPIQYVDSKVPQELRGYGIRRRGRVRRTRTKFYFFLLRVDRFAGDFFAAGFFAGDFFAVGFLAGLFAFDAGFLAGLFFAAAGFFGDAAFFAGDLCGDR